MQMITQQIHTECIFKKKLEHKLSRQTDADWMQIVGVIVIHGWWTGQMSECRYFVRYAMRGILQ